MPASANGSGLSELASAGALFAGAKHPGLVFGSPLCCSRVLSSMNGLDAPYYRAEAKRCQEAAAQARDPATKEYWLKSERCWIKLANQAELVADLNPLPKVPTPQKKASER